MHAPLSSPTPTPMPTPTRTAQVCDWFAYNLGLGQYRDMLQCNSVDGLLLVELTGACMCLCGCFGMMRAHTHAHTHTYTHQPSTFTSTNAPTIDTLSLQTRICRTNYAWMTESIARWCCGGSERSSAIRGRRRNVDVASRMTRAMLLSCFIHVLILRGDM